MFVLLSDDDGDDDDDRAGPTVITIYIIIIIVFIHAEIKVTQRCCRGTVRTTLSHITCLQSQQQ